MHAGNALSGKTVQGIMIDQLKKRNRYAAETLISLNARISAEVDIRNGEIMRRALRRHGADVFLRQLENFDSSQGIVPAASGMIRMIAIQMGHTSLYVQINRTASTHPGNLRQIALGIFACAL